MYRYNLGTLPQMKMPPLCFSFLKQNKKASQALYSLAFMTIPFQVFTLSSRDQGQCLLLHETTTNKCHRRIFPYFSLKFPSFNFSIISWPSAWVEVNFGIAPLGPKQFLRRRSCFGGKYLELRVAWPRTAAAAPDAKSRTPAVGLATVPTIPLPIPVMKP